MRQPLKQESSKSSERMLVKSILDQWQITISKELSKIKKVPVHFRLKQIDQLRLMNLKVWSSRYQVPLKIVLQILTDHWGKYGWGKGSLLGVKIATFTGPKSRQIVEDQVLRLFPAKENEAGYKCEQAILKSGLLKNTRWPDPVRERPDDFVASYKEKIRRARKKFDRALRGESI